VFLRRLPNGGGFQLVYRAHSTDPRMRDCVCAVSGETAERLASSPGAMASLLSEILARELEGPDGPLEPDEQVAGV
jgi:hypothetical protein